MKDLKSELSKNLERLIIGLMLTPAELDAKMMRKAIEVLLIQPLSVQYVQSTHLLILPMVSELKGNVFNPEK